MKVTDCCGVAAYSNGDSDTEEIGICPGCLEHCEYVDDDPDDMDWDEEEGDELFNDKK